MGNWNSNQWSEEVIEGVGNTLGKDSMVYFKQQIEALDMAQQMLQSGEIIIKFTQHPYALKYVLQGLKAENNAVIEKCLELINSVLYIAQSKETNKEMRFKILRGIGRKIMIFWSLIGDDHAPIQLLVAGILAKLTTISKNTSKLAHLSVKQILFFIRPNQRVELKKPLTCLLKHILSEPVTLCTVDKFGPEDMLQEAFYRRDMPERYMCAACSRICGDQLESSSMIAAGKQTFSCSCAHCNMCTIELTKPDRVGEILQLRGLDLFANLIGDPATDPVCIENILACLMAMTDTDTIEMIRNRSIFEKKIKYKEKVFHEIVFRHMVLDFVDKETERIMKKTGAGTRIIDMLHFILNPPSTPFRDQLGLSFSTKYPNHLRSLCLKNPMIEVFTLRCLSNICKGIPRQRYHQVFEIGILSRIPGYRIIQESDSDESEDDNDDAFMAEEVADTIARDYNVSGKFWHEKILAKAIKLPTNYSKIIVSMITEMKVKYKEKLLEAERSAREFSSQEIQRLKHWEKKFLRVRVKENPQTKTKMSIMQTPRILKIGNRVKEGWKLIVPKPPEAPLGAKVAIFYTEINVEGYNEDYIRIPPEKGLLKPRLQFPLWELQEFTRDIAMVDLKQKYNHRRSAAYKEILQAKMPTKVLAGNVIFKRPGMTKVNLVVAFVRPNSIEGETRHTVPYEIRQGTALGTNMKDAVIIGLSEICTFRLYVNQPLRENIDRVRNRLFRKSRVLNAERCIIDTFSRGLSDTLRDSSSVVSLLGSKLGEKPEKIDMTGWENHILVDLKGNDIATPSNPLEFHSVNGMRILVERKRAKLLPSCLFANLAILHFAAYRKNDLLRHQVVDLMDALNEGKNKSWVKHICEANMLPYKDVRDISITYYLARSLFEVTKHIVLMEPTLAQRFMLLLGRTFLDFIDIKRKEEGKQFDEDTMLFAIRSCGLLPMGAAGLCADYVVKEGNILKILIGNQAHNSSEAIIAASIEAIISFGMIDRFKQQMLHPPKPKEGEEPQMDITTYLKVILRDAGGMVNLGEQVTTFAKFGEVILAPREMTLDHTTFERNVMYYTLFQKSFEWADANNGHPTEHRWKAMGTLVAFSRSFGTHYHLLQAKRFKFILQTALFSSPEFSLFGTAPCQAEALQVLLNLTKSPLGMSLWMPFMEPMRLALDYSGNYQPVVALGVSRKPHWIGSSHRLEDDPDMEDTEFDDDNIDIRHASATLYRGVEVNSKNVFLTHKDGVSLSSDWTISFWFRGGEWIQKRKLEPNFFYTLVESTNGDKVVAMNHLCELGTLEFDPPKDKETGIKPKAKWYGTEFDLSNKLHTGEAVANRNASNKWFHIVLVGQTIKHEGQVSSTTMFYFNGTVVKTLRYKCSSNVYAIGNTAQRGGVSTHWDTISEFRLYNYAFPRSSSAWPAEVRIRPAVDPPSLKAYDRAVHASMNPFYSLNHLAQSHELINGLFHLLQSPIVNLNCMALKCMLNLTLSIEARMLISKNTSLLELLDEFTFCSRPECKHLARKILIGIY